MEYLSVPVYGEQLRESPAPMPAMSGEVSSKGAAGQLGLPWIFPQELNHILLDVGPPANQSMCEPGEAAAKKEETHTAHVHGMTCEWPFPGLANAGALPNQPTLDYHVPQRSTSVEWRGQVCSQWFASREVPSHGAPWQHGCGARQETYAKRTPLKQRKREVARNEHACGVCGKSFAFRSHLDRHLKVHTGETPHACHLCPRKFARNDNLQVHLRIHAGERPHVCRQCGRCFARTSHLSLHTKRIHNPGPVICCEFCPGNVGPIRGTGDSPEDLASSANQLYTK